MAITVVREGDVILIFSDGEYIGQYTGAEKERFIQLIESYFSINQGIQVSEADLDRMDLREELELQAELAAWVRQNPPAAQEDPNEADGVLAEVPEMVDGALQDIGELVESILVTIAEGIEGGEQVITSVLEGAAGAILGTVGDAIELNVGSLVNLGSAIDNIVAGEGNILDDVLRFFSDQLELTILNKIEIPADVFQVLSDAFVSVFDLQGSVLDNTMGEFGDTILAVMDAFFEAEALEEDKLAAAVLKVAENVIFGKEDVLTALQQITEGNTGGFGFQLHKGSELWSEERREITADHLRKAIKLSTVQLPDDCSEITSSMYWEYLAGVASDKDRSILDPNGDGEWSISEIAGGIVDQFFAGAIALLANLQKPLLFSSAEAQAALISWSRCNPWKLMEPGDTVQAWHRGLLTDSNAVLNLQGAGYDGDTAQMLLQTSHQIPGIGELLSMWLRGAIDETAFDYAVRALGYSDAWLEVWKETKFFIPPPQDLITMAVREVFNEDQARAFGQFEDFPPDFAFWAEKQGISEDWAKRYWAAHWTLPSVQMAFTMFHRREINREQLEALMKAQDIMPAWREPLIQIAYQPLTRVDVRRMHDLGVLNDDQVKLAYQDLGYSPENAELMLQFTKVYNQDEADEVPDDLDGLTRATIISSYEDGSIERPVADELLTSIGIGKAARALYLNAADLDIQKRRLNDAVDIIEDEFRTGAMNLTEALVRINLLDLTRAQEADISLKLQRAQAQKTKLPSKADLDKMLAAQIITEGQYRDQMEAFGYAGVWIDRYIELIKLKGVEDV